MKLEFAGALVGKFERYLMTEAIWILNLGSLDMSVLLS